MRRWISLKEYVIPIAIIAVGIPMCVLTKTPLPSLIQQVTLDAIQSGILLLALLPPLQTGMGFNFGTGLGAWAAQIGFMVAASHGLSGPLGTSLALVLGLLIAASLGGIVGWLLSKVPGFEMLMTLVLPHLVTAPFLFLTEGIRALLPSQAFREAHSAFGMTMINLRPFNHSLDFEAHMGPIELPMGTIAFLALAGLSALWFQKSLPSANSRNPGQATVSTRKKAVAFALSLMIACTGRLVVLQNFPAAMPHHVFVHSVFPIIPALIAGGALLHKARLHHAFLGMVAWSLFFVPLADLDTTFVIRALVPSGLILYALMRRDPSGA